MSGITQALIGGYGVKPSFFGATETGSASTTSLSLTLPASIPSGATIYVFAAAVQTGTTAITISNTSTGYTEIRNDQINASPSRRAGLWSKVSTGAETSVTITASADSVMRIGCIVINKGSGYASNSLFQNSNTSAPDPASVTFAATGSVALVIYYGVANAADTVSPSTVPSGYTTAVSGSSTGSIRTAGLFGFYKENVATGTEDPASFTTRRAMSVHTVTVAHEN